VSESLAVTASANYLWGENRTRGRPVIGIAPVRGSLGARYEPGEGRFFVQGSVSGVAGQERVAEELGETPTDGYVTADIKGGVRVYESLHLRLGVQNLTDTHYVNHLNAKNPFSGTQVPEPGRVFTTNLTVRF
jgi:iron complex outermembrane receptor protein